MVLPTDDMDASQKSILVRLLKQGRQWARPKPID